MEGSRGKGGGFELYNHLVKMNLRLLFMWYVPIQEPLPEMGVTEAELREAVDAVIRRRSMKLQGLKAYLKRVMPCQWGFSGGSMATVPEEMDSDSYRSPTTRLTMQQSIVIGEKLEWVHTCLR